MTVSMPKDSIPKLLQSYIAYQFTCAGCNACYIGETRSHLKTRIEEHLGKDKNSQILKHLQENPHSRQVFNFDCLMSSIVILLIIGCKLRKPCT